MKKTIEDILVFVTVLVTFFGTIGLIAGMAMEAEPNTLGAGVGIIFGVVAGLFISAFYSEDEKKDG